MFSDQLSRERLGVRSLFRPSSPTGISTQLPDSSLLIGSWGLARVDGQPLPTPVWPEQGSSVVSQVADNLELLPDGRYRSSATYRFVCPASGTTSTASWEFSGTWKVGRRIHFRTSYGACYSGLLNERVLVIQRAFGTYEYLRQLRAFDGA